MCPVSIYDQIKLNIEPALDQARSSITRSGSLIGLPESVDLTFRACQAFLREAALPSQFNIHIEVLKAIPDQAGLGGGSSDAASVLWLLQSHFNNPLSEAHLNELALSLGADVPFFLQPSSAFIEGIGEQISPLSGLSHPVLIYKPLENCPTQQIFQSEELTRDSSPVKIAVFDSGRLKDGSQTVDSSFWEFMRNHSQNSLQKVVESLKPEWLAQFEVFDQSVRSCDSLLSRMTGSGSAMFAVFENESQRDKAFDSLASLPGQLFKCCILQHRVETG